MIVHVLALFGLIYAIANPTLFSKILLTHCIFHNLWAIGITAGSHRLWAHKSYQANIVWKTFIMILNSGKIKDKHRCQPRINFPLEQRPQTSSQIFRHWTWSSHHKQGIFLCPLWMVVGKEEPKTDWGGEKNWHVWPSKRSSSNVPKEVLRSTKLDSMLLNPDFGILLCRRNYIVGWFRFILHNLCFHVECNMVCELNLPHVRKPTIQPQDRAKRKLLGIFDNCWRRISQLASRISFRLEGFKRRMVDDQPHSQTDRVWFTFQVDFSQDILKWEKVVDKVNLCVYNYFFSENNSTCY